MENVESAFITIITGSLWLRIVVSVRDPFIGEIKLLEGAFGGVMVSKLD